jgi:hypothetical protein
MTSNYASAILIIALSLALALPSNAQRFGKIGYNGPVVGPIIGAAAVVAAVIFLAIHYSKKRSITGCVASTGTAMTVTDENDKKIYALSGNTTGVKPGDRMKLKGQKVKPTGPDKTPIWKATDVNKDFGVCHP